MDETSQMTEEDRELYSAYFGKSEEYYLNQIKGDKFVTRFSFLAFFFSTLWMVYRKMYWQAAVILFVLGVIFVFFLFDYMENIFSSIAVASVYGFTGNTIYLKQAKGMVNKAKETFVTHSDRIEFLSKKGGVSYIALIVVVILSIVITLASSVYLEQYDSYGY